MINQPNEYRLMATAEGFHWWYKHLHTKCFDVLFHNFSNQQIKILDAGCGTGGLMAFLKDRGYQNIKGFDLSEIGVKFCLNRDLDVWHQDIKTLKLGINEGCFDSIFSCDTLCYLSEEEIRIYFNNCYDLLNVGGLLIINLPALKSFSGIHDIAVGIKQRFVRENLISLFTCDKYEIIQCQYWPFLISPFIYIVRLYQRIKLYLRPNSKIESDIKLPSKSINWLLYIICRFDQSFLRNVSPFGSSIFLVLRKT